MNINARTIKHDSLPCHLFKPFQSFIAMSPCKGSHWFQELRGEPYSHTCRPHWCHRLGRGWSPRVWVRTPQVLCTGFPKPGNTPAEWLLTKICSISLLKVMFPNLVKLSAVAQSLSVTNAWPERGASDLKWIKTRLRNSLKDDMLDSLLQISINGPLYQKQKM